MSTWMLLRARTGGAAVHRDMRHRRLGSLENVNSVAVLRRTSSQEMSGSAFLETTGDDGE
eukprot:97805-Prorocentrum_minimum.AAC.1